MISPSDTSELDAVLAIRTVGIAFSCRSFIEREAKPTVPEIVPIVQAYISKDGNAAGGSLHIVLEDGNISDGNVDFCLNDAIARGDLDGVALARVLRRMSKTQRKRVADNRFSNRLWLFDRRIRKREDDL